MTITRADITALIPAAGRVPDGVLALSNVTCPAMIPVAGRPVIQWTLGYLTKLGIRRFDIAVAERGLFVEEFVECVFGDTCEIRFVVPAQDRGVGGTVHELAAGVETRSALVVLGDTHFELADPSVLDRDEPVLVLDQVDESYRWCVAHVTSDGLVKGLQDKVPGLPPPLQALIGVYWFPDVEVLRTAAADAVAATPDGARTELLSILDRVGQQTPLHAVTAGSWLDCGNPDRQAASQRALLAQRAFNELSVDETFGTITKRSAHTDKFVDEINYLRLLPPELAVLFPRALDFSTDYADPYLTMEFYGYPTLAELFVFENVDPAIWRRVFDHLFRVVTEGFMRWTRPLRPDAIEQMLLGKVRSRAAAVDGPPALVDLLARPGDVVVNGRSLTGLADLDEALTAATAALAADATGAVIHGDLCFSNVLYDLRSGICKFIDPRGSFGDAGIHGDPRYDVAKLFHSVYGLYDFVTADLFHLGVDLDGPTPRLDLDIRTRPYHDDIRREFEDVFFGRFDRREILLITGLIFLGLPGLHYDHPPRQLAFYARGLELVHEALGVAGSDAPAGGAL